MGRKTVFRRRRANDDILAAVDYYQNEAGAQVAMEFIDELEASLEKVSIKPTIGSLRYAQLLNLPGLRSSQLKRFPYLIFYREREGRIELERVLHGSRDIPAQFDAD